MAIRCAHGTLRGFCELVTCAHWRGPSRKRSAATSDKKPRGDASRFSHPGFVDMTGKCIGKLVVVSRAPNVSGNARWHCKCDCGEFCVLEGIKLRDVLKRGSTNYSCPKCRPAGRRGRAV